MTAKTVEEQVMNQLVAAAYKEIDVNAIISKNIPKMKAKLEKAIQEQIDEIEMADYIYDEIELSEIIPLMCKQIMNTLKEALDIPVKEKKKSKKKK